MQDSQLAGLGADKFVNKQIRNSKNIWIPTDYWISGWLWYYITKANRENFLYDITDIDNGSIQYTHYGEGQYYNWHSDGDINVHYKPNLIPSSNRNMSSDKTIIDGEMVRKISFSLQLSGVDDYTGGEFQFLDNNGKTFFAPKQRGTLVIFDSRVKHRVRKVTSGIRKSLVGWVVGPRWR